MVTVTVEVLSWLRTKLGHSERARFVLPAELAGEATVGDLLARLARTVPGFGEHVYHVDDRRLDEHVVALLNGRALELAGGLTAPLRDGDRLVLLPGYAGG